MSGRDAWSRRRFLGVGAAGVLGAGAVAVGLPALGALIPGGQPGLLLASQVPLPRRYAAQLPIPSVLQPVRTDGTTDYYEITARPGLARIVPGHDTEVWGYQALFPGPTIESRSGRRTVVTHRNELPHPTVVHLHGGHTPHDSDGYPMDLIAPLGGGSGGPGGSGMAGMAGMGSAANVKPERVYDYPMNQRAATLWYHDHTMGFTGPQVYRGLAGFHLVRDDEEASLGLPQGARELPLMLADRAFAADGSFAYPALDPSEMKPGVTTPYMNGVLGDVILVNGAPWPFAPVDRARYRLRILNASNARRYRLELDPQPPGGGGLLQIGSDGGLLARPVAHDGIELAPAERFDVVVDFSRYPAGSSVRLVNRLGSGSTAEVMRFDIGSAQVSDDSRVPGGTLAEVEKLDPAKAVATRTFVFNKSKENWTINGEEYRPGHSLASPKLGQIEVWRFVTDFHHPVHLHLDPFQVISRNAADPGEYDAGWKDTVDVLPAQGVEVAVRFSDYAGRFLLHCHNLEHEDMAMMAEFTTQ
ncbi:multicopper oxidase family protein [Streptacidiphilus jiangxiensis]|uniref:Multicopper oxidase CueO n=1 Tax=Streptacidiphilus jiangxiensis TaxID=235985 RepID=A0A1H7U3X2_STRJI|nr:multicopper oxidase family protein [Streptacidiphilus jiangxiensis]SEL90937.1 Multicopper oxidase with three cupredoxin domains (includes cell division protein FtsP and spore coat protein CotA) [Streptacidiphilus jiangxiensis]